MNTLITLALLWVACGCLAGDDNKKKKHNKENTLSNTTVMWLCPLFWPLLIAKLFFGGKQVKQDTRYADWEEHKRRTGR